MPGRRSLRYHLRQNSDSEFETPALQIAAEGRSQPPPPEPAADDSDDELQSESGLGESPEEDLIDEIGLSSDDDKEDNPDSDSDSAPEEVSFAKSREAEEKRQQRIMGEIRDEKSKEKERRRKRDELFKLQKKAKLAALIKRKLPEEVLEELNQQSEKKQKKTDAKEDEEAANVKNEDEDGLEEDDFDLDSEEEGGGNELGKTGSEDFLPLAAAQEGQLQVISLKKMQMMSSAANFRQEMLYGKRHKRITNQQSRMQRAKRLARR